MDFINENVIKCLKQEIDVYREKYAIALQEIKELNYFSKEDNKKLQASHPLDTLFDKEEIKELNEENEQIAERNKEYHEQVMELKEEIKELKRDIKHKAIKLNQSHYPKEYKQESNEYFEHNPHCKKLLFFMIEGNEFDDDGDYDGSLYASDCIAEIDNV